MPFFDDAPLLVATKSRDKKTSSKLPAPSSHHPSKVESQLDPSVKIGPPSAEAPTDPRGNMVVSSLPIVSSLGDGKGKIVDVRTRRVEACSSLARRIIIR